MDFKILNVVNPKNNSQKRNFDFFVFSFKISRTTDNFSETCLLEFL